MSKTARGQNGLSPRLCLRLAEPNDIRDLELLFEGLVGFPKRGRTEEALKAIKHKEIIVATIPVASSSREAEHLVGVVHGIIHNDPISAGPLLYITALFVKHGFRRQGIGYSLLDAIIRRSVRYWSIEGVEVSTALNGALRFYKRLGFTQFKADFGEILVQIEPKTFWAKRYSRPKFKGTFHRQEPRA